MNPGTELGERLFNEADQAWQEHLAKSPEDVGDLVRFFGRLREKAEELPAAARRERLPLWEVKEAFRAAAEKNVRATVTEWKELAGREAEVFDTVIGKYVPAATHALIFPNQPPASAWNEGIYALLHESLQRIAREIGLEAPDHPPPEREPPALEPPPGLNRQHRRMWLKRNRRAA
ncbi:hypothetical protein [Aureimonas sp. AU22]|uniref:hypothetical protein n=1 Tax=Aureimonas sp. AU22 TaxID=1638162 RepID=UPI000706494F|nr:hypothetical protein [Aureimonas sp. AU22]BAT30097.1 hypothetical protein [Aureimonas sp. AU22]